MWTKRSTALCGAGVVLAFIGAIVPGQNHFYTVLGFTLMAFVGGSSFFLYMKPGFRAVRVMGSERVFEGDFVQVTLEIQFSRPFYGIVELYDEIAERLELEGGCNFHVRGFRPGDAVRIDYVLRCPIRGYFHLGPVKLRLWDPFFLFYREESLSTLTQIQVVPSTYPLENLPLLGKRNTHTLGSLNVHNVGQGTEFYCLRDYQHGDPFHKINWKSFSRSDDLKVNEFEREDVCDIMIILDSRRISGMGTITENALEYSARAAATLSKYFIGKRDKVGFAAYGSTVNLVHPDRGDRQLMKIFSELSSLVAKGGLSFRSAFEFLRPSLTRDTPIMLISNLLSDPDLLEVVREMTARGYWIYIVSPSTPHIEKGMKRLRNPAFSIVKMERDNFITELRGSGARVADWIPGSDFKLALAGGMGHGS